MEETKQRRFVWPPTSKPTSPALPFQSAPVLRGGGGGGGSAFRAPEISPLTEVAVAAIDDLFGPTSERGVDVDGGRWTVDGGRWTATATTTLRLAANGLAFLLNSSLLRTVFCDFPQIWKSFPFVCYL